MPPLEFFDVNVTLGRPRSPKFRVATDPAAMRADLAQIGVTGGLVRHSFSAEWHPLHGNPEASRAAAAAQGFQPVWALLPHWTGEFPAPDVLGREMSAAGVRAAILYPQMHNFPVRPSVTGPLFEMLAAKRVVTFLPHAEAALSIVETLAREYPRLPLVVSDTSYALCRELYPVFAACPNVHVETSGFMVHRGIEDVCEKFGPGRLLFGTRYPLYNPGCAVAGVMYARIPDAAKAQIASGNAQRLLAEVITK